MKISTYCNGIRPGSPPLDPEVTKRLKLVLPVARELFKLDVTDENFFFGGRFTDDHAALERIRAAQPTANEVLNNPVGWALDALRDCAATDYHYRYEKVY